MDPRHPLATRAEASPEAPAEEGEQGLQSASLPEDEADAHEDDADAQVAGFQSGFFPFPADVGQKSFAGGGGLIERLVTARSVIA